MNVGDKVYKYKVTIDFMKNTVEQTKEEMNILGINERQMVFNDYSFTKIMVKKEKYDSRHETYFNKPSSHQMKFSSYDYMTAYIYTDVDNDSKQYKALKKELQKKIDELYGRYCSGSRLLDQIKLD